MKSTPPFKSIFNPRIPYKIASLDMGSKMIGLAISDPSRMTVTPKPNISRRADRMTPEAIAVLSKKLDRIVTEEEVRIFVIGLPIYDGKMTPFCNEIINLISAIRLTHGDIICTFWDESYSTEQAKLVSSRMSSKKSVFLRQKDGLAASFILQGFINYFNLEIPPED